MYISDDAKQKSSSQSDQLQSQSGTMLIVGIIQNIFSKNHWAHLKSSINKNSLF